VVFFTLVYRHAGARRKRCAAIAGRLVPLSGAAQGGREKAWSGRSKELASSKFPQL
jgi:hypothetical protein